jgi:hypothetical protein
MVLVDLLAGLAARGPVLVDRARLRSAPPRAQARDRREFEFDQVRYQQTSPLRGNVGLWSQARLRIQDATYDTLLKTSKIAGALKAKFPALVRSITGTA